MRESVVYCVESLIIAYVLEAVGAKKIRLVVTSCVGVDAGQSSETGTSPDAGGWMAAIHTEPCPSLHSSSCTVSLCCPSSYLNPRQKLSFHSFNCFFLLKLL